MSLAHRQAAKIVAETEEEFVGQFRPDTRATLENVIAEAIEQGVTWTCHVCGDARPDRMIRVFKQEYGEDAGAKLTICVRYCADRPDCGEAAAQGIADRWARRFQHDTGADRVEP
jgi:hypothetical protein